MDDAGAHWGTYEILSDANIEEKLRQSPDTWIVQWCSPLSENCENHDKLLRALARELAGVVRVGSVNPADALLNIPWRHRYRVSGFPTIQGFFHGGVEKPTVFVGQRTVEDVSAWARALLPGTLVRRVLDAHDFLSGGGHVGGAAYKVVLFNSGAEVPSIYRAVANRFSAGGRGDRLSFWETRTPVLPFSAASSPSNLADIFGLAEEDWPAVFVLNASVNTTHYPTLVYSWKNAVDLAGTSIDSDEDRRKLHSLVLALAAVCDKDAQRDGGENSERGAAQQGEELLCGRATLPLNRFFTVEAYSGGQFDPFAANAMDHLGIDFGIRNVLTFGEGAFPPMPQAMCVLLPERSPLTADIIHSSAVGTGSHDLVLRSHVPFTLTHFAIAGPRSASTPVSTGFLTVSPDLAPGKGPLATAAVQQPSHETELHLWAPQARRRSSTSEIVRRASDGFRSASCKTFLPAL